MNITESSFNRLRCGTSADELTNCYVQGQFILINRSRCVNSIGRLSELNNWQSKVFSLSLFFEKLICALILNITVIF